MTGLPNGLSYDTATGAIVGTLARLSGGFFTGTPGGASYSVTIDCGETTHDFLLQHHDYIRQPASTVGGFTAFNDLGIVEATFTMADDAAVYDGPAPDGNPITDRTVTVTKQADGTWTQDNPNFFITAYDTSEFSVVATDADGRDYSGTGSFGTTLRLSPQ